MMNSGIFLLLGSNEGDRLRNLEEAFRRISLDAGEVVARSTVYRTAAWGMEDQPDFYNQVVAIRSPHGPEELLGRLLAIERAMGRVRRERWGPRLIDIDLLFYGNEVIDTSILRVPHPGIPDRKFTLLPLAEIAPDLVHPVLHKTIAELLRECKDRLGVERLGLKE